MKKQFLLAFSFLFISSVLLFSCKQHSNDDSPNPGTDGGTPKAAYEKKWNVSTASQRVASTVDSTSIASIEFNLNTYIIILTDNTIITGTFTANGQQLVLTNYGTVVISQLSGTVFDFSVQRNNNTVDFSSSPAPVITTTDQEPTFYKTWKVILDGSDSSWADVDELYVTFSEFGTYMVQTKYKNIDTNEINGSTTDGKYYYDVNTWKWSDGTHGTFCYGPWDHTNTVVCGSSDQVKITFTNADKSALKMDCSAVINDSITYNITYNLQLQ